LRWKTDVNKCLDDALKIFLERLSRVHGNGIVIRRAVRFGRFLRHLLQLGETVLLATVAVWPSEHIEGHDGILGINEFHPRQRVLGENVVSSREFADVA